VVLSELSVVIHLFKKFPLIMQAAAVLRHHSTEQVNVAVMPLMCTWEVCGSCLGRSTGYLD